MAEIQYFHVPHPQVERVDERDLPLGRRVPTPITFRFSSDPIEPYVTVWALSRVNMPAWDVAPNVGAIWFVQLTVEVIRRNGQLVVHGPVRDVNMPAQSKRDRQTNKGVDRQTNLRT